MNPFRLANSSENTKWQEFFLLFFMINGFTPEEWMDFLKSFHRNGAGIHIAERLCSLTRMPILFFPVLASPFNNLELIYGCDM